MGANSRAASPEKGVNATAERKDNQRKNHWADMAPSVIAPEACAEWILEFEPVHVCLCIVIVEEIDDPNDEGTDESQPTGNSHNHVVLNSIDVPRGSPAQKVGVEVLNQVLHDRA